MSYVLVDFSRFPYPTQLSFMLLIQKRSYCTSCSINWNRLYLTETGLGPPSKRKCPHLIWIKGWYLIAKGPFPFKSISLVINF